VDNSRITQSATGEAPAATGRRRRRSVLWISFLGAGLLLSTVWATGFANSQSANGAPAPSVRVNGTPHEHTYYASPYEGLVSAVVADPLTVDWNGYWGRIATDESVFKVDLSGVAAGTYYIEVLVKTTGQDWDAQQYRFILFHGATCDGSETVPTSGASFTDAQNLNVTTQDSYVSFQNVPKNTSGEVYCIGVKTIDPASDTSTTFLRRPQLSVAPTPALLTALVNRSS